MDTLKRPLTPEELETISDALHMAEDYLGSLTKDDGTDDDHPSRSVHSDVWAAIDIFDRLKIPTPEGTPTMDLRKDWLAACSNGSTDLGFADWLKANPVLPETYRVKWFTDIDATSPREAAVKALASIIREGSIAHAFDVAVKGDVTEVHVDLDEDDNALEEAREFDRRTHIDAVTDYGRVIHIDNEAGTISPVRDTAGNPITLDITPEVAKTPEGARRIQEADDELSRATTSCAQALRELVTDLENTKAQEFVGSDNWDEAQAALRDWSATTQAFLESMRTPKKETLATCPYCGTTGYPDAINRRECCPKKG